MKNRNRKRRFVASVESMEERFLLSAVPRFSIKDLGIIYSIGGQDISSGGREGMPINNLGQIIATVYDLQGERHAAVSSPNGNNLSIIPIPQYTWVNGDSINDQGQVVVSSRDYVLIITNGQATTINALFGSGINRYGNVSGTFAVRNSKNAFYYDGTIHDLGSFPAIDTNGYTDFSIGSGVNDSGQVVGWSAVQNQLPWNVHAFLSAPNGGAIHDLGTITGDGSSWGYAVNNSGQVAGTSDAIGSIGGSIMHAFVSDPNGGALHDLGVLPGYEGSQGFGINNSGDVVGFCGHIDYSIPYPTPIYHAFVNIANTMYDLNSLIPENSGFTLTVAKGINDKDQIAVEATDPSGQTHALLLTPVPPAPSAPTITWSNPADIVYGTPLSATQLNATADVPGTFTYNVAAGTVLHAGAAQSLVATFTPDDTVNYTTVTTTASINVLKAPLTVTANSIQVHYGFQIPPLTGTITGLVNGDTDVATYTTTATQGSGAAYYPIVPHLTDPNYNITYVNGTLLIYWSIPPGW